MDLLRVIVAAAWEPELETFRALAGQRLGSARLDMTVVSLGVGVVDAAIAMTRRIAAAAPVPEVALLLGTCGSAVVSLAVGDVVAATSVRLVDASLLAGAAEAPAPMAAEIDLDPGVLRSLVDVGARPARVANTIGVTVDDALAARIGAAADVEHLEAFGFARACAMASPPVRAGVVLGVANPVGAAGRAAWAANHRQASAKAAAIAVEALLRMSTRATSPARA